MLRTLEMENGVTQHWKPDDKPFRLARDEANDRQKRVFLHKVHSKVMERWFLLSLKAKYAGIDITFHESYYVDHLFIFFPHFFWQLLFTVLTNVSARKSALSIEITK